MTFTQAERHLIECVRDGREARFSDNEVIDAELIRKLMLGLPLLEGEGAVPTPCGVRVFGAVIRGRINLNNGRGVDGSIMPGLVIDDGLIADGIDLSYAQLGKLSIERTAITEVRAVRAVIHGEVIANDIRPPTDHCCCYLNLYSARIDGDIQVRRAVLREPAEADLFGVEQYAFDLRNAVVKGNVFFRDVDCHGTVNLSLATLEGNFTARSARIVPVNGRIIAIHGDGADIKGTISLRRLVGGAAFQSFGQISLIRANFAAVVMDGAEITPKERDGFALNLESATIEGGLYLRDGFRMVGLANMRRLTVRSDVNAPGAAMTMGADAVGLTVAGEADFSNVITDNALIDMQDASIGGVLRVGGILAHIDLSRAKAGTFDDAGDCWLNEQLILDGFHYDRLKIPGHARSHEPIWKTRLAWLARQSRDYTFGNRTITRLLRPLSGAPSLKVRQRSYNPQPFLQLSRVLSNTGYDKQARRIMRAKQWIEARHEDFASQLVLRLFGICFGFGYSSKRALTMLGLYFLLGWWGTTVARDTQWLVYDVQPAAIFSAQTTEGERAYNVAVLPEVRDGITELPCNDVYAYSYALDLMIPLIDLHVEDKCEIRNSYARDELFPAVPEVNSLWQSAFRLSGITPPVVALFEGQLHKDWLTKVGWNFARTAYALIGWLVVSMSILTFSGLLRQRDSLG